MRRQRPRGSQVVAWVAGLAVLVTCASLPSLQTIDAAPSTVQLAALQVDFPAAANPATAPVYVADAKGLFQQAGLTVHLTDGLGGNVPSAIASGQADIAMLGTTAPLLVAKQGKPTTIIYNIGGGGNGGTMVAGTVRSVDALRQLGHCRIVAFPPGSSAYGFAAIYVSRLHLPCDLAPMNDGASQIAAVTTGRADAMVTSRANVESVIRDGKVHVLIDTRSDADRLKYLGPDWDYPEFVLWGLTDNLASKRESVVRFMHAVGAAMQIISKSSPQQIAEILHTEAAFRATPVNILVMQIEDSTPYMAPGGGYLSARSWQYALTQYAYWGVAGFSAADPVNAYKARVDMSYYERGIGKPTP